MSFMMQCRRRTLYIISTFFWLFAAVKVLSIAWYAWDAGEASKVYWAFGAYFFFAVLIFPRVVRKNILEIQQRIGDLHPWYTCFTPRSWAVMFFMMALGISLRVFDLVSMTFIAGFYSGLGLGLLSATRPYIQELRRG